MRNIGTALGIVAIAGLALGAGPAKAHHSDWGLPLLGGMVGGAGLTALYMHSQQSHEQSAAPATVVQPVYVAPAATVPATVVPVAAPGPVLPASTIEDKLNVLDQLAAKGYITPAQYQARRQALLDQL